MPVSASALRADIYTLLDHVLETGEPLEIERKGRILRVIGDRPAGWLHKLSPRASSIIGDADSIVCMDWSSYWKPDSP